VYPLQHQRLFQPNVIYVMQPYPVAQPYPVYVTAPAPPAPEPPPSPPATVEAPPPPIVVPTGSRTLYVIPGCYLGNVPPDETRLRAGCDISKLRVYPPQ
jgi:hypothetical protein